MILSHMTILFLTDTEGNYPKMDFIIPKYKWELEGLRKIKQPEGFPFPVLSIPYLIAMKLKAGGPRDYSDIVELFALQSEEGKKEAIQLATRIKKNKTLENILRSSGRNRNQEDEDEERLF